MRDFSLIVAITIALGATLLHPFAGIILWTWFSVQSPHEEAYSFSSRLPLNFVIALVTMLSWLVSKEQKKPPNQFLIWATLLLLGWMTFNSFFAFAPEWSWPYWDRTWKIFALGILIATLANNSVRIHAVVWTVVASLFYFGVKGGLFTILTGGAYDVFGPRSTIIADNNQLAVALLMALPLANYLRRHSSNRYIAWALVGGMLLSIVSVIGSHSRGGFVGLMALSAIGLLRSNRRIAYLAGAAVVGYGIYQFMPQSFWDRINTIQFANSDSSFHGREVAWQVAWRYAVDHFPFGAGFYGPQLETVFHSYFPTEEPHAAHSIFFQVLGEHGFIGLAIYLAIMIGAFSKCSAIIRISRNRSDLKWASDLAAMIQTSLFVFCVAGAALSMAYYDVFVICTSLLVPMGALCAARNSPTPATAEVQPSNMNLPHASPLFQHGSGSD